MNTPSPDAGITPAAASSAPSASATARILIVDDEKNIRLTLCAFLQRQGYEVGLAEDAPRARVLLAEGGWDVVVTDIVLPGASGVELLKAIRSAAPDVQVIMMTGEPTVDTATEAIRIGASDYLTKPIAKEAILRTVAKAVQVKHLLDDKRRLEEENRAYVVNLERLVDERTSALRQALDGTIHAMAAAVESGDPYTAGHQQRVGNLARRIAQAMDLPEERIIATYYAGIVHDLGKICIPTQFLTSPAKLSKPAMDIIREHPTTGFEILKSVPFPWAIAEMVNQHHERWDGSGYPRGLSGNAISEEAYILAVADVVEAMASHRPYRPALGIEAALAEIGQGLGTLYENTAASTCLRLFREDGFRFDGSPSAPAHRTDG